MEFKPELLLAVLYSYIKLRPPPPPVYSSLCKFSWLLCFERPFFPTHDEISQQIEIFATSFSIVTSQAVSNFVWRFPTSRWDKYQVESMKVELDDDQQISFVWCGAFKGTTEPVDHAQASLPSNMLSHAL